EKDLHDIIEDAIDFPAPTNKIQDSIYILELFHGPTLAFKDFGARFMARVMNYYWKNENKKLQILVATSGATGGAVAAGFSDCQILKLPFYFPKEKYRTYKNHN